MLHSVRFQPRADLVVLVALVLLHLSPTIADAFTAGLTGRSTSGCGGSGCHSGGTTPGVSIRDASGAGAPFTVVTGSTSSFRLRVAISQAAINDQTGGFNVSRMMGALLATETGTQLSGSEIAHAGERSLDCTAGNCQVEWTFDWTAPSSPTSGELLRAAGLSANNAGGASGDAWSTTTAFVTVVAPPVLSVSTSGLNGGGGAVTGPGIDCGSDCTEPFALDQVVTLTASPNAISTFTGWGGACSASGTSPTCAVTMSGDQSVTAQFTRIERTITVQKLGTGVGTVTGSGISCGATCTTQAGQGTTVTLSSTPATGSTFTGWSGGACAGTGICSFVVGADTTVIATFATTPRTLTVTPATGGTINGPGIDCGTTCQTVVPDGTILALSASPQLGYVFAGWSGACVGTGACSVTMDQDRAVFASFTNVGTRQLTVARAGLGSGAVTSSPGGIGCGSTCTAPFTNGQVVTLTATPDPGSEFAGWSDAACPGAGPCVLTMSQNRTITATFDEATVFPLTVSTTGAGTVTSGDGSIDCGLICSASYAQGTLVTLTAVPDPGYALAAWSGDCFGTSSCSVTMDHARSVSAEFVELGEMPDLRVALFTNDSYVDYIPGSADSEAANLEVILADAERDVTSFTALDFELGEFNVIAIPELERGSLDAALDPTARASLATFVRNGGALITFRDFASYDLALLNSTFGWALASAGPTPSSFSIDPLAAGGTPFASGPAVLPSENATQGVLDSSLPSGARVVYRSGETAGVWIVRHGQGWVVSIGWDFFDAAPVGPVDNGWLGVFASAIDLAATGVEAGLFVGNRYVDYIPGDPFAEASNLEVELRSQGHLVRALAGRDEVAEVALFTDGSYVDYTPGSFLSEAANLESLLQARGNDVLGFTGTTLSEVATALVDREVLIIPELENGVSLATALDAATQQEIADFVREGGTLVSFGDDYGGLGIELANTLFGFSIGTTTFESGSFDIDDTATLGTSFAGGPTALPFNDATYSVPRTGLPPEARPIYRDGDAVAAFAIPVENGWLVWLGWDWYNAQPVGSEDGGWLDVLDRTLALRGSFATGLSAYDVVVIPELEGLGSLVAELSPAGRAGLTSYVAGGGRLVTFGGFANIALLNDLFGWSLIEVGASSDQILQPEALGTAFQNGPLSLPNANATSSLAQSSLPPAARPLYRSGTAVGVAALPVGDGVVTYLGWDFFNAAPVGLVDDGWLETLNIAIVPEPSLQTALAIGALALGAVSGRRRRNARRRGTRA